MGDGSVAAAAEGNFLSVREQARVMAAQLTLEPLLFGGELAEGGHDELQPRGARDEVQEEDRELGRPDHSRQAV